MKDKGLLMLGGLIVVLVVFGLKVWHAQVICADLSGRWAEGECYFDEKPPNASLISVKSRR